MKGENGVCDINVSCIKQVNTFHGSREIISRLLLGELKIEIAKRWCGAGNYSSLDTLWHCWN